MLDLRDNPVANVMRRNVAPIEAMLNTTIETVDVDAGKVEASFDIDASFANQNGFVAGGVVASMLDIVMAAAGSAKTGRCKGMVTLELKVTYLRPAPVGRFIAVGTALQVGSRVAFLEAELFAVGQAECIARSSCTSLPIDWTVAAAQE